MLKNILNFEGAQKLTNTEQKMIKGGYIPDLSNLCGAKTFPSTQTQCMSLTPYNPIWDPATRTCSVIGDNCGNQ